MFRWLALVTLVCTMGISASYRYRARQSGAVLHRRDEGTRMMVYRALVALPLFASVFLSVLAPRTMAWAAIALPDWLRWVGVGVGALAVPSAWWVFSTLGRNVSETVLTKSDQKLVTTGPYRWVRHPLYTTGEMLFIGVGLMVANGFVLGISALVVVLVAAFVVPPEEAALESRFGDAYRDYCRRTGRFVPRFG